MSRAARSLLPALRRAGCGVLCDTPALAQQELPLAAAACQLEGGGLLAAARAALRPWQPRAGFAARPMSGAAGEQQAAQKGGRAARRAAAAAEKEGIVAADEGFSAITDKIPQRPVTVTEAGGYSLVILGALAFAGAVGYAALNELLFTPKEYQCFNHTLAKIKDDPRVTVRLGTPISAYGQESQNRAARQRIPHRVYNDGEGREHLQLQFVLRGPSGRATVNADMSKEGSSWRYSFLYLDVEAPVPQQVVLVRPGQTDDTDY
ncbi:putative mitochondrial import inner membrane translocase subunit TIM21 isoform B [Micractinium conductrix]|uniref:Mitochondrial import inner membrane translocase subunit Tim21 n=1 Tax=Micractinium conductrix TaxID=554055 RepID=A0A2P6UZH4_9CHLO|nr:putative mitochondrial import inner membrane translocase subunit TIM21 isoform B [Micractinium conductrix]|eukprot:PSC67233.1 putative mitochondrial import inner membrane translocase subunit TIM21 isoform B [Micractinium conductrix]